MTMIVKMYKRVLLDQFDGPKRKGSKSKIHAQKHRQDLHVIQHSIRSVITGPLRCHLKANYFTEYIVMHMLPVEIWDELVFLVAHA